MTPSVASAATAAPSIALIGNPNTGKTTLFNALTGGRARTGNYPGVTVDKRFGLLKGGSGTRILDLPGTYSLAARSPDEMVAVDVLLGRMPDTPRPAAVVVVVDAANLERNLYLVTQVIEVGLPTVVALNMADTARARSITIDKDELSRRLGVPVVETVAADGEGVEALAEAARAAADGGAVPAPLCEWPEPFQAAEARLARALPDTSPVEIRRALVDVGGEAESRVLARALGAREALDEARRLVEEGGLPLAAVEATARYRLIGDVVGAAVKRPEERRVTLSDRIDAVLTHRLWGTLIFVTVMTAVFLSIFTWAGPLMDFIDGTLIGGLAEAADGWAFLGDGMFKSLVIDGIIAGVGAVIIFLPQIVILFGFLAILEACGYMARAAFLMDRLLRWCGLSGRSFIPMLSSFACAIPGIMAARTIESRRDRIATIMVAPLMSCSARIPVYVILIAAFIPATTVWGLNQQGLVFAGMYFLGILVAIPVAYLLKKTWLKGDTPSFLVELPPYRVPRLGTVIRRMTDQGRAFLVRAGTMIFAATIVVWALSYFPRHPDPASDAEATAEIAAADAEQQTALERLEAEEARQAQAVAAAEEALPPGAVEEVREAYEAFRAEAGTAREEIAEEHERRVGNAESGASLRYSALGRMGKAIEPVFAPIGWDWKISSAVVASFPAREVVVSTLGVIYNMGPDEDEESEGLRARLKGATWDDGPRKGERVLDLAGALALMVFFALCAQCASTLVIIRKETGTWGWAAFAFVYMTVLAYLGALLTAVIVRGLS